MTVAKAVKYTVDPEKRQVVLKSAFITGLLRMDDAVNFISIDFECY